ncbi:hypothetical protein DINM_001981 [Dirofilaria immitis]|nr:hypothetical protein [Dirofilaria immitis]
MAEQLSTLSRETFRESIQNQREQAIPQSSQQLRIEVSGQRNELSLLSEVLLQRIPIISRAIIDSVLIDGVRELLLSSSSSLQQSYLQQILQQAQQYTRTSQQRHPEENNQFIIQLPVQTNQQPHQQPIRMFQQSHAEQSLLQIPLPLQMLHLINSGNNNNQMLLQLSQLLANSNLRSRGSSVAFQESYMQTMESLLPQTSQQENSQSSHFCTRLPQQTNRCSQQQQQILDVSQQQRIPGTQQLLLQISQQIPVFSLQQPTQQMEPLLVRVFQQSSQQPCAEGNRDSLLQAPQQSVQSIQQPIVQPIQQIPVQSLQQMLSTQQAPIQSSQQSPILPIQQPNPERPSIF